MHRPRKRKCKVCGQYYRPDLRTVKLQTVCSKQECKKERHRRSCKKWRRKNPFYDREEKIRTKLIKDAVDQKNDKLSALFRINWDAVRAELGLGTAVILEEIVNSILNHQMTGGHNNHAH